MLVPRKYFGGENVTVGNVSEKLTNVLDLASENFEYGIFGNVPGGFALVARMERIHQDGTPLPDQFRWMKGRLPVLSFRDYLVRLFMEKPGYFRVIVFLVTDEHNFIPNNKSAKLPMIISGAKKLPKEIDEMVMDDQECYALIYTFQRRAGGEIRIGYDGSPSGKEHLRTAGVWTNLEPDTESL